MRGTISIDVFTTLDGVAQGPGGVDEDTSGGFRFSGWQAPLGDEEVGTEILAGLANVDALLLGRRTYDIFAGYWPSHGDNPIGASFNAVPKYVASRGTPSLTWQNSHLLDRDHVLQQADALRDAHSDVHVIGSLDFAHTLLEAGVFDRLRLWVYPIVLGHGKRLFPPGAAPRNLRLLTPARTSASGVVTLDYGPRPGIPATGTIED